MLQVIGVLLPLAVDHAFTYNSREKVEIGQLVRVPFRNKSIIGVVITIDGTHIESSFKIVERVYDIKLSRQFLSFLRKVAGYNIIQQGMVFKMALSVPEAIDSLQKGELSNYRTEELSQNIPLTKEQEIAAASLKAMLLKGYNVCLLDGVTGSGKTEVYLNVIEEVINCGGQALVLLPEILLTSQLIERFKKKFKITYPVEWHSGLSLKVKKDNWQQIVTGKAKFIVGARSALFLPYKDLKIVVIDEEHDLSYKQEEGQVYNARDMAILRAKEENIMALLSSATPSIETIHNVKLGKYDIVELRNRYGDARVPQILLVDINKDKKKKKDEWISSELRGLMVENYNNKKQTLLFLNRRGYAPMTFCGECRHKVGCPNCNFNLVEHRNKRNLQCHYCGYVTDIFTECPHCGNRDKLTAIGPGVERLEQELATFLPNAKVTILTSDTVINQKKVVQVLESIANNQVDVIIGSQMVTKGLHFPNLELVGVVDAESNVFGGDIRALERMYQVLHQVAGRAGRQSIDGKVVIQTLDPKNAHLQNLKIWNRQGFIDAELEDRKAANMPPYSRVVIITASSLSEKCNIDFCNKLAIYIPQLADVRILGPSLAPIFMLRRRYRHRFVVIAPKSTNIQSVIKQWLNTVKKPANIKIKIDVDPYNFF